MRTTLFTSTLTTEGTATPAGRWGIGHLVRRRVELTVRTAIAVLGLPAYLATLGKQAGELVSLGQDTVRRIVVLVDAVEVLVADIARTAAHAARVAAMSDAAAMDAAKVSRSAEDLVARVRVLRELYEPVLNSVHPTLDHVAAVARPRHVDSLAQLVDLTPELLDLITPALRGMGELSPELGQLAERFETIGQIVEGLPGAGMLRRRGREQDDTTEKNGENQ